MKYVHVDCEISSEPTMRETLRHTHFTTQANFPTGRPCPEGADAAQTALSYPIPKQ